MADRAVFKYLKWKKGREEVEKKKISSVSSPLLDFDSCLPVGKVSILPLIDTQTKPFYLASNYFREARAEMRKITSSCQNITKYL